MSKKVLVIGLDCVPPSLLFERFLPRMPVVQALIERGTFGPLRSIVPPITVPAWASMVTGLDAGRLGLYGFRNRVAGSYNLRLATGRDLRAKTIFDYASEAGRSVASLFVPLSFPPRPVNGVVVGGCLTPGPDSDWAFPPERRGAFEQKFGPLRIDVPEFRSSDRERVLDEIYAMGRQHFAMARSVLVDDSPDLTMMVELGPDRFHHAFWQTFDSTHPRYDPDDVFQSEAERYYTFLDAEIGKTIALVPSATVLIVSDHGAKAMRGAFCINQWLIDEGYLALREAPAAPTPLTHDLVDWRRTRVWATGGYYARLFVNLRGREPAGIVSPRDVNGLLAELERGLVELPGPNRDSISTQVVRPLRDFPVARGMPPDLMAFIGDLDYRSIGRVGVDTLFQMENDSGPDGCNHDWDGVYVLAPSSEPGTKTPASLLDIAPTVLHHLGLNGPSLEGSVIR
ncbi:MAG: alkaline phosphatase family protein [Myxococcota bacterium]